MALEAHVPSIANVIQLAIAPVFMLTAIGSFLGVIINRLARAVDRARELEHDIGSLQAELMLLAKEELYVISRRARWTRCSSAASSHRTWRSCGSRTGTRCSGWRRSRSATIESWRV